MESPLITGPQLAKYLGISLGSVTKYSRDIADWPPQVRIGRRVFYRKADVEAFIEGRARG